MAQVERADIGKGASGHSMPEGAVAVLQVGEGGGSRTGCEEDSHHTLLQWLEEEEEAESNRVPIRKLIKNK